MDLTKYEARDVALWIAYDGGAYRGFAAQEKAEVDVDTVERQLFQALEKTCLVGGRDACAYSRCGRTDKGVSAAGQVVGLRLRSVARRGTAFEPATHPGDALANTERRDAETDEVVPNTQKRELDYVGMLNRVLPDDVRALAWAPVAEGFSARTRRMSSSKEMNSSPSAFRASSATTEASPAARVSKSGDSWNFSKNPTVVGRRSAAPQSKPGTTSRSSGDTRNLWRFAILTSHGYLVFLSSSSSSLIPAL